jgi:hypothetical protein
MLPLSTGARWVLRELARAAAVSDTPGAVPVHGFRDGFPGGFSAWVSRWVSRWVSTSEQEAAAALRELAEAGFIELVGDESLILKLSSVPSAKKAEASRINGLKGGRPRKRRSPPEQPSMLLPINGRDPGRGDTSEPWVSVGFESVQLASSSFLKEEAKLATNPNCAATEIDAGEVEYVRIGRLARDAAGLGTNTHFGVVRKWLRAGASEDLILTVIRARTKPDVGHLGYFTSAIHEALAAGEYLASDRPTHDNGHAETIAPVPHDEARQRALRSHLREVERFTENGCAEWARPEPLEVHLRRELEAARP